MVSAADKNAKQEMTEEEKAAMLEMLDDNLDDIPDLPVFGVPPKGSYKVMFKGLEPKSVNNKACQEVQVTIMETRELTDPEAVPPAAGMEVSELVWFHNDPVKAKGVLKLKFQAIADELHENNLKLLVEKAKGMELYAFIDVRKDKEDKEKLYPSIVFTALAR